VLAFFSIIVKILALHKMDKPALIIWQDIALLLMD
jgi:hypothetical protein